MEQIRRKLGIEFDTKKGVITVKFCKLLETKRQNSIEITTAITTVYPKRITTHLPPETSEICNYIFPSFVFF